MESRCGKNDKMDSCKKVETKNKNIIHLKKEDSIEDSQIKSNSFWTKSLNNQNGFCPKSVRNHLKKTEKIKEKHLSFSDTNKESTEKSMENIPAESIRSPITNVPNSEVVAVTKIDNETFYLPINLIKNTVTKPSLIYCTGQSITQSEEIDDSKHVSKNKRKKKHSKSKVQDVSDVDGKDSTKKLKKSRKSKKKKNKDLDSEEIILHSDKESKKTNNKNDATVELKGDDALKSFLVSYSSDEDDANIDSTSIKKSPEVKLECINVSTHSSIKPENKIEIKLKPTKSPGKSTWESSESEIEIETKKELNDITIAPVKSPYLIGNSPLPKESKSKSKSKSLTKSLSDHRNSSRSISHNSSYNSSRSSSYSDYSRRSSKSYSRSRSHSKRRSRRRRHYSSSSSSYSRSRSRYSRSSSRSTSYSRSSRSYTRSRSRSRYKSSYSSKYRSRTRSHSSRSNSYYRSTYRKRKRSSSHDKFLNVPTRKVKAAPNRNSILQGGIPRHVDIAKKIDAIKESQRKTAEAQNNENVSSLNIPLPPDKPKGNLFKAGDAYTSIDLSGPASKKSKKTLTGNKTNTDLKAKEKVEVDQLQYIQSSDYNYIGPQVSSDMAKRLGLDVKNNHNLIKKEKNKDNCKTEPITSDCFVAPTLDAAHMALQSRAYQHRLHNLQGSSAQDIAAQSAQYYHPMYMSASSLSNNLTAIASAAVANEQLPASVAGSLAQAAVQRIMSSSNLTATYNTPSVMASSGTSNLQTAFQHGIPQSCGTLMANTPSGLIPISLLQQGGFQVGINPLILQQLQQQALNAQFGQAISLANPHALSGLNQLLLQASNQQALLQSLGVNAQAQLLGAPLTLQHTLLLAAQQQQQQHQQQQQLFAAAQINQATLQAAHLQAQIQAQARAVSLQNLQQAAQMQSSAQNMAPVSIAGLMGTDAAADGGYQRTDIVMDPMAMDSHHHQQQQQYMSYSDSNGPMLLQPLPLQTDNVSTETAVVNQGQDPGSQSDMTTTTITTTDYDNAGTYNPGLKQQQQQAQVPRIVYNAGPTTTTATATATTIVDPCDPMSLS